MRNKEIRRKNLLILIERFGKKSTLANAAGANADYISQIANKHRDMGDAFAQTLESGLQLPDGWMDDIHEPYSVDLMTSERAGSVRELPASQDFRANLARNDRPVPQLPWPGAESSPEQLVERLTPLTYLMCPIPHGRETFCISVKNDSMTTSYGKSYPLNSIVFIDPGMAGDARQGHRVFARLENGEYVFKELAEDAGKLFLRPLNPHYQPIFERFDVIGKVIGKWEPE